MGASVYVNRWLWVEILGWEKHGNGGSAPWIGEKERGKEGEWEKERGKDARRKRGKERREERGTRG